MKAFYFAKDDLKLRYGDGRTIEVGATHTVDGKIKACVNGLHASINMLDALTHAPGCQLFLVELGGDLDERGDKVAASKRTYLAHFDAGELLRKFAKKQALITIEKIEPYCSADDYKLIISYLTTGNEGLRSAAWSAADSAARAAWSAADSAARAAAWSARSAAELARLAAWSAAESAAWSAAWSAANDMLTDMLREAAGWDI